MPCSSLSSTFPGSSAGKESTCNAGDPGSIPGSGRATGEGKGYPLQYSGLENSMDSGVAKSQTPLSNFHFHFGLCQLDARKPPPSPRHRPTPAMATENVSRHCFTSPVTKLGPVRTGLRTRALEEFHQVRSPGCLPRALQRLAVGALCPAC